MARGQRAECEGSAVSMGDEARWERLDEKRRETKGERKNQANINTVYVGN